MPTHEEEPLFLHEFGSLTVRQQALFVAAMRAMVEDLRAGRPFRKSLRIKAMSGHSGIYELTWDWPDGRATFQFGREHKAGEAHIIWRRIGGHEIYKQP